MKKIFKIIGIIFIVIILFILLIILISFVNHKIKLKKEDKLFKTNGKIVEVNNHNVNVYISGNSNSDITIDKDIEGEYTGYQLTLTASYEGYGEAGQDLGSGTIIKTYNISDNDIFYEPFMGGIWRLNLEPKNDNTNPIVPNVILKINKIENENIELEYGDNKHIVKYNEEISISSNVTVYDGTNYSYRIKISKEN